MLLPFAGNPAPGHEIVSILSRTVEEVVLDVANDRVDAVLKAPSFERLPVLNEGMSDSLRQSRHAYRV